MTREAKALAPKLRFPVFRAAPEWSTPRGDTLFDSINNRRAAPGLPVLAITQEHGAIPRDQIDYHVSVTAKSVASYKEVCEGDFIISLRSFQGGIEYSRYHGICSPAYVILRRKGNGNDHFFRHLFKSSRFIRQLTRNIEGIRDGKMISYAQFSEQLLPVPEPPEQQKIAECLGSLDDLIAAEGRKLAALRQHKRGLLRNVLPRDGNAQPAVRFSQYRDAEAWNVTRIGDIADYENGKAYEKDIVDNGRFVVVNARFISTNGAVRKYTNETYCIAQTSDVLIVLSDLPSAKALARCFLVDADDTYAVNQRVAKLRPHSVDSRFLLHALDQHPWLMAFSDGINQTHLSKGAVLDCPLAVPRDDGEQKLIGECLRTVDSRVTAQEAKLAALTRHKNGLLQQLFPSLESQ